jgi:anti-sigma28 factor (negative regulator of flagellin synthesis)
MKIHNDGLQGTNPVETGRTQGPHPAGGASSLPAHKVAGHEGDSIEISGISQHLADSNALDGKQRENRVAELAALYAKGQYNVSSKALSQKLVAHSVAAGEGGQK